MSFRWRSLGLLPRKKSYWIMKGKSKSKGKHPLRLRCPTGCWRRLRVASSWTSPAGNRHRIPGVRVRFSSTSISYPQSKGSLGSRGQFRWCSSSRRESHSPRGSSPRAASPSCPQTRGLPQRATRGVCRIDGGSWRSGGNHYNLSQKLLEILDPKLMQKVSFA